MSEPVIVAVPPKGGSLKAVLDRVVDAGWIGSDLVKGIQTLIKRDKARIKLEETLLNIAEEIGVDDAAITERACSKDYDPELVAAALARMRRYTTSAGTVELGFAPKPAVDAILAEWRRDADPMLAQAAQTLHLELDVSRYGRPSRMMFDHHEFHWTDPQGRPGHGVLVGTDHEVTPTYLRRHKRDVSLTCYDAFQNTLLDAVDTGKVHNWSELMDHLIEANTDVRILGSLGLNDYLGHFVLMPEAKARQVQALDAGREWGQPEDRKLQELVGEPVLIDANYEALYLNLLDADEHGIEFEHTTRDIEEACAREGRTAIYIVQSGGTIARTPGLCVVGSELLTSETIVAVNKERLEHNSGVEYLVDTLQPSADDKSNSWRDKLAERLGDKLI